MSAPRRPGVPAEPASPDQLPEPPAEPDLGVSVRRPPPARVELAPYRQHYSRVQRRRDRIAAEIERNRRGEAAIPTWVLAAVLVVLVAGITALVIFS